MIGGRRKAATLFVPILVSDVSGSDFMADDRITSMILDLDTFHCVRRLQGRLEQKEGHKPYFVQPIRASVIGYLHEGPVAVSILDFRYRHLHIRTQGIKMCPGI
jgi:hypothetical protein